MDRYHQRRPEQAITDPAAILAIIRRGTHLTLALADGDEPYLVTVNYGYDEAARAFFFHCGPRGKKVDLLRRNPVVWGQVLEDLGYHAGHCQHAFRTVQFRGTVRFLEDPAEKERALTLMIDQLEPAPDAVRAQLLGDGALAGVLVGRVQVEGFTAKQGKID